MLRQLPRLALLLPALAALACGADGLGVGGEPGGAEQRAAVEVAALVWDNESRCLGIGREAMRRYETGRTDKRDQGDYFGASDFLRRISRPEQQVGKEVNDIVDRLMERVRDEEPTELFDALSRLRGKQRMLCTEILSAHKFPGNYRSEVAFVLGELRTARRDVEALLSVSEADARRVRERYRAQLAAIREGVREELKLAGEARDWLYEFDETLAPGVTPEEFREERQAWRQEQERRERQRLEQEALHRQAVEQSRAGSREQAALPRLGLAEAEAPLRGREPVAGEGAGEGAADGRQAMRTWHARYAARVRAARIALSRFLQLRATPDDPRTAMSCRSLYSAASDVLVDRSLWSSPEAAVNDALERAYEAIRSAAESCLAGDFAAADRQIRAAEQGLAAATAVLARYGLEP